MLEGTSFIEQYPGTNNSLTLRLSHCHITAATSDAITTQRLMHKTGAPEYYFHYMYIPCPRFCYPRRIIIC